MNIKHSLLTVVEGKANKVSNNIAQSMVEVIVAVAILLIIAGTSTMAVLGSFSTTRLAEEETGAALLAVEGMEAVQSIRNQGWDDYLLATDCTSGCGLDGSSGWQFSGNLDTHTITPDRNFNRVVTISQVQRDGGGEIVESGGTLDTDSYKVVSSVTWNFTPARQNTVEMVSYLTNWQESRSDGEPPAPTPTPSPTPTSTPTPTIDTCSDYCLSVGYSLGTCRANQRQCENRGETYESAGDLYCTGGGGSDTCCCAP